MTIRDDRKSHFQLEPLERRDTPSGGNPNYWGGNHHDAYFFGTATGLVETQSIAPDGTLTATIEIKNGFSNILGSFLGQINSAQSSTTGALVAVGNVNAHQLLSSSVPPDTTDTITLGVTGQLAPISGNREQLKGTFVQLSGTGQFAGTTAHGRIGANLLPNGIDKIVFYGTIHRP